MTTILKDVIIDGLNTAYLKANITIKDGIISEIETAEILAHEIDRSQFYVTSGFVNSHIHPNQLFDRRMLDELPISALLSGMHTKQKKTDQDRYAQAIFVLIDALKSGATSMYAVASSPAPVIQAFNDLDLTGAIGCFFHDVWEGDGNPPEQTHFDHIEKKFSEFFEHNSKSLKIHIGTGSILTASNKLLLLFEDIAKRYNTKVNLHISEGIDSVTKCLKERGTTPVRLLRDLGILNEKWNLIHVTTIDTEEVKIIADSGASIIHCPVSNAKTGVGIAPMLDLYKNNVTIGLGTDACSNNNTNNILNEAYFATLLQGALHKDPTLFKEEVIFDWMTTGGFKIIDSQKSGKLEIGERADLLLWHLNAPAFTPLPNGRLKSVLINNAPDVKPHTVLLNGKKVIENYTFIGSIEEAKIAKINMWAASEVNQRV